MPCSPAFICIGRADRCKGWVMPPVCYWPGQKENPYGWVYGRGGSKPVKDGLQQPKPMRRGSPLLTYSLPHETCLLHRWNDYL